MQELLVGAVQEQLNRLLHQLQVPLDAPHSAALAAVAAMFFEQTKLAERDAERKVLPLFLIVQCLSWQFLLTGPGGEEPRNLDTKMST